MPAASSSVTNISETVTATATANASSGVLPPLMTVCLTWTGLAIEPRIGPETSRLSAASWAKRWTCSSAGRCSASGGRVSSVPLRIAAAFCRPRMSIDWPSSENCPPWVTIRR